MTDQVLARITRYRSATGRRAVAWLIVVVDDPAVTDEEIMKDAERFDRFLAPVGRATVIRADEIDKLRPFAEPSSQLAFA